jgi:hypothetical protein
MTVTTLPADPLSSTVFDSLTVLAACLCEQIRVSGLPETCFCGVVPGEAVVAAYAGNCTKKCGMAWVRLVSTYPASGVNVPNEEARNCGAGIGYGVEAGILRCAHIGTEERPPTASEQMADAQLQIADMLVIRRAVACCPGSRDWILGTYTPAGPQGGLFGGVWTMEMWMP